jgi:glycosyltransferase involved in cell wall biosynthesis
MLAGEGPSLQSLIRLTEQLRVQSYVHFLGRRSDINRVLANSDIFVLSSYHEGLPNSLMEAMAMGLPCISTNVGGVEQLITDHLNGIIVESKSSSSIIKALEYFINQKDSARKMGTEAYRKMITNYRQPIVSKELVDIYINM